MTHAHDPLSLSLRQTQAHLRSGDLTPRALTTTCLDRIAALQPVLHAMVRVDREGALQAADAAAACLAAPAPPLMCGIPVVIKDIVDVAGVPTRCGSPSRDTVAAAASDAAVVSTWRAGGAVILGKSVTQEFAAGTLSPPARNPWDPDRVPGGSSGGSAVAVATGMALAAIGTDTGGSIRNPAAICGVTGLKPTYGALPTTGVFPLAGSLDTVGPLTRGADDAWIAYRALLGAPDAPHLAWPKRPPRLGVLGSFFHQRVDPAILTATNAAVDTFAQLGATIVTIDWADAAAARAVALLLNRIEATIVHRALLTPGNPGFAQINPALQLRLLTGQLLPATTYAQVNAARVVVRDSMARLFRDHQLDAVLAPVAPATAVRADAPWLEHNGEREDAHVAYTRLTQPFNATGQPVLSIPSGFDHAGLPIGLQIAGRPGTEMTICALGHQYQQATDWLTRLPPTLTAIPSAEGD